MYIRYISYFCNHSVVWFIIVYFLFGWKAWKVWDCSDPLCLDFLGFCECIYDTFSLYIFVSKVLANSAKLREFLYPTFCSYKIPNNCKDIFLFGLKVGYLEASAGVCNKPAESRVPWISLMVNKNLICQLKHC